MSASTFYLLGGIELTGVSAKSADGLLAQVKVVGLLAYLALAAPGRYQRRDRLCGLLWQELDQSHARTSVRKAVFAARRVLGAAALELYRGELMPGFHLVGCAEFGSWLDGERSSVAQKASAAAWTLAIQREGSKDLTRAGQRACQAVTYEWSDERVLRRTMQLLVRIGDRAGALKVFEDCARRMRLELETEPSAETVALAASLRAK